MSLAVMLTFVIQVVSQPAVARNELAFTAAEQQLEARLLTRVGPVTRAWIKQEAARENASGTASLATASRAVASNRSLGNMNDADVMALAFLVMMEAAKSAREDLKSIMDGVKRINNAKAAWRQSANQVNAAAATTREKARHDLDSLNKMGDLQSLRLQMAMDRQSKFMSSLSNVVKKMSETSSGITQNLK